MIRSLMAHHIHTLCSMLLFIAKDYNLPRCYYIDFVMVRIQVRKYDPLGKPKLMYMAISRPSATGYMLPGVEIGRGIFAKLNQTRHAFIFRLEPPSPTVPRMIYRCTLVFVVSL